MGDSSYGGLLSPSVKKENHILKGSSEVCRFVYGRNVVISVSPEESKRERDSSRIHTKILSDFKVGSKLRLLTAHGDLYAYHLAVEATDVIRISNRTNSNRHLIKNTSPRDLQFAAHAPLLAAVNSDCNLVVYKISENCEFEKYAEITGWNPSEDGDPHISWCPYYPETPNDPEDYIHMLALYKGRVCAVLNISNIHEDHGSDPISFEKAAESIGSSIYTITMEDKITACCISPDSTALAVGTDRGIVSFYVINETDMTFAHNWDPHLTSGISHLHFLDSLDVNDRKEDARFWKHCVAAGNGGRRLALYECVAWKCLGSLRFESELTTADFSITVDPQLRYIHILDVDGMNLFCVELDFSTESPKFSSLTQITFCHPLNYLIPIDVTDEENEAMFPNDEASDEDNRVNVKYIGVGSKSMLELAVNLEKYSGERFEALPIEESDHTYQRNSMAALQLHLPSTSDYHPQVHGSLNFDREVLENRLHDLSTKLDNLTIQVENSERDRRTATTNENLLLVLQQFKEEFSLREDRLMANISDLIETNRTETLQEVRNALGESQRNMEALVQSSHKHAIESVHARLGEKVRETVNAAVVPQVERICSQMFKQLNETFRTGLEQYMAQFRALHSATLAAVASATPAPSVVPSDRQALLQMIKNHQVPLVFETVLTQDDQHALEFVCKNIDPDELSMKYRLGQQIILDLIAQISSRFESETELRFRYLPPLLENIRVDDTQSLLKVQSVLADLLRHLSEYMNSNMNISSGMKIQARMLSTIATMKHRDVLGMLKPHLQM